MPSPIRRRPKFGPLAHDDHDLIDKALQLLTARLAPGEPMHRQRDVHNYLRLLLAAEEREVLVALYLDGQQHLLASEIVFEGGLRAVPVSPRILIQRCLEWNAAGLIIAHNHPSGAVRPSKADRHMTERVKEACELFEINLVDSLIIGCRGDLQVCSILNRNPQPEYQS